MVALPSSRAAWASSGRCTQAVSPSAACASRASTSRRAPLPDGVRAHEVDVTDRASVARAVDEVVAEWGVPHVLINNAGLDSPPDAPAEEVGPFEEYPEASFDAVMDVNVKGTFLCCQAVGGAMAREGRGSIVNVSSVYGLLSPVQDLYEFRRERGETFVKPVAYSVSKSAVLNLTRYLATYWAKDGVRVNTLTLSGVWNDQPQEFLDAYAARRRWAACWTRTRRSEPSSSSPPTRRRTSPARTSSSTAAGRLGNAPGRHEPHRRACGAGTCRRAGSTSSGRPTRRCSVRVARSGADDVDDAVAAARAAQPAWAERTAVARGDVVRELALLLRERREEASAIVVEETGKPAELALGETDAAVEMGLFIAGEGRRSYGRTTTASMANRTVLTVRQPLGVAALIMSFNTPLPNVAWKAFPAIFCGNAAVVKPSEHTPASASFFAELALEAGVPAGVLNVVHGLGDEAGRSARRAPGRRPRRASRARPATGRSINEAAARRLAKTCLELGGKNALVVCDDADLDQAVHWALASAFSNAGQRCASASRIVVLDAVYDAFRDAARRGGRGARIAAGHQPREHGADPRGRRAGERGWSGRAHGRRPSRAARLVRGADRGRGRCSRRTTSRASSSSAR